MFLTFDVEPDAPPYQSHGFRGVEEGLPWILALLERLKVKATFFLTGTVAERYPGLAKRIVDEGHELGSHGYDHARLDRLPPGEAERNLARSMEVLRRYADVRCFRAPNLQLPPTLLPALRRLGVTVDSSAALYKRGHLRQPAWVNGVLRVPVTVTSSTIRLPSPLAVKATLPGSRGYHSLFYHPWEFIRVERRPLHRPDIWARTGSHARRMLEAVIREALGMGYRLTVMGEAPRHCEPPQEG